MEASMSIILHLTDDFVTKPSYKKLCPVLHSKNSLSVNKLFSLKARLTCATLFKIITVIHNDVSTVNTSRCLFQLDESSRLLAGTK